MFSNLPNIPSHINKVILRKNIINQIDCEGQVHIHLLYYLLFLFTGTRNVQRQPYFFRLGVHSEVGEGKIERDWDEAISFANP